MPQLTRTSKRLLRNVDGKTHATEADHHDLLPTPPPSNSTRSTASRRVQVEDETNITADPESSDDDQLHADTFRRPSSKNASSSQESAPAPGFKHPIQLDGPPDPKPGPGFKRPAGMNPQSTGSKRSAASELPSSDSEAGVFGSQTSNFSKRQKTIFKRPSTNIANIHAGASTPQRSKPKTAAGYGSQANRQRSRAAEGEVKGFKKAKGAQEKAEKEEGPMFKTAKGAREEMFEFGKGHGDGGDVSRSADAEGFVALSPSLSSLSSPPSSPGVEEIETLNLAGAGPYVPKTACTICGTQVELFLKQDFEDQFNKGQQLNYKWQQRFCRYHKQHSAKELWRERGYPEIDWDGFQARLQKRKHTTHVKRVISGEIESVYRSQLEESRKKGGTKSALQAMDDEHGRKGGTVGYYGPRGEKVMYVCHNLHIDCTSADTLLEPTTSSPTSPTLSETTPPKTSSSLRLASREASRVSCKLCWCPN